MRNSKRIIGLLLCALMVLALFPVLALGQSETVASGSTVYSFNTWRVAPAGAVSANSTGKDKFPTPPESDEEAVDPAYDTSAWPEIPVPGSLLGGLIDLGMYDDMFAANGQGDYDVMFDDNITKIPNDFDTAWWYSTDFELTADEFEDYANLNFKGISYTGEVWVNGTPVYNTKLNITNEDELRNRRSADGNLRGEGKNTTAPYTYVDPDPVQIPAASTANRGTWEEYKNTMQGSFRHYDLDVTGLLVEGTNNITVKVTRGDRSNDFNYNFHDWHMTPVCRNMGITYPVTLTLTGSVRLANPLVTAKVQPDLSSASVNFYVDVNNMTNAAVTGRVNATVTDPEGKVVKTFSSQNTTIPANAYCYEIGFGTQTFTGDALQLWWPYLNGDQPLYHVEYKFVVSGTSVNTDSLTHRFGIREIGTEVNKWNNHNTSYMAQIYVNHKPITIKGGGFCPYDLYLRQDQLKDQSVLDLCKQMGFNTIRDEGKFFNDYMYDLMDEEGILLMTGYMCCDRNEIQANNWGKVERFIVYEQTYDQMRSLRSHPSFVLWLNGSDYPKDANDAENPANIAHKMLEIEGRLRFYDHGSIMISAVSRISRFTGAAGGSEMDHTYDSASPTFMFGSIPNNTSIIGNGARGVFGFVSEGIGGAGIPSSVEGIYRMIPEDETWPFNQGHQGPGTGPGNYNKWSYHACRGGNNFDKIDTFVVLVDGAFGGAQSLEEWVKQTNLYEYDMQRAQYEALSKHRYTLATGFINWMLNGTRPVIMWNQFDFDMNPHGSTYGSAKANEAVHIMYDQFRKEISVINSTFKDYGEMTATMELYDINGNVISEKLEETVNVVPDGVTLSNGGTTLRPVGKVPEWRNGDDWYEGDFDLYTYVYGSQNSSGRRVTDAHGVNTIWTSADIKDSLNRVTSDVYFIRLELLNDKGEVVSYNAYAVPRRQDVFSNTSGWSRASMSQTQDWTQLMTLPEVEIDAVLDPNYADDGKYIVQKMTLTNNTDSIAHGVELRAFINIGDPMLCPATYDDNLITLFPGESRTLTISHLKGYHDGPLSFVVDIFNNVIEGRPNRVSNVYAPRDPVGQTTDGTTTSTPNATTNLARNRGTSQGTSTSFAATAATQTAAASVTNANLGTNILDSDVNTGIYLTTTGRGAEAKATLNVDLGSVQTFDRTMLRFSLYATQSLGSVPSYVQVQVSNDAAGEFVTVAEYDNAASAPMANILFDEPATARYIRYNFTGLPTESTAYGSGSGSVSSQTTAARTIATNNTGPLAQIRVSGLEVYRSYNNLYVEVDGDDEGTITVGSETADVTADGIARTFQSAFADELTVAYTPGVVGSVSATMNGEDITDSLTIADKKVTFTQDSLDANADVVFTMAGIDVDALASAIADFEALGFERSQYPFALLIPADVAATVLAKYDDIAIAGATIGNTYQTEVDAATDALLAAIDAFVASLPDEDDPQPVAKYVALGEGQLGTMALKVGATAELKIDTNSIVLYLSSAPTTVSVTQKGVITGVKAGIAVITVRSVEDPSLLVSIVINCSK